MSDTQRVSTVVFILFISAIAIFSSRLAATAHLVATRVQAGQEPRQTDVVEENFRSLKDPNPIVRRDAASKLGQSKDPRILDPLIAALQDTDVSVVGAAANALVRDLGDQRGIDAVAAIIGRGDTRGPIESVSFEKRTLEFLPKGREAAHALALSENPRSLDALIATLDSPDHWSSVLAAEALGLSKQPRAREALVPLVSKKGSKPQSSCVCLQAAVSLARIGGAETLELLGNYLKTAWQFDTTRASIGAPGLRFTQKEKCVSPKLLSLEMAKGLWESRSLPGAVDAMKLGMDQAGSGRRYFPGE